MNSESPEGPHERLVGRLRHMADENGSYDLGDYWDACEQAADRIEMLEQALVEARRWIGDGDLADGLHRDHWTPRYALAVALVDAALMTPALTGRTPGDTGDTSEPARSG
jgi:hypothetical protein